MAKERCFEITSGQHKGQYCKFISSNNGVLKLDLLGKVIEVASVDCSERVVATYSSSLKF